MADSLGEWASSLIPLIPAGPHQGPLHQKATLSPSQGRCNLETWSTRPLLAIPEMVSPISSAKVNFLIRNFYGKAIVALPIVDVTLYQILHPQLGTNAALCDGVTVAMTRALQKAACCVNYQDFEKQEISLLLREPSMQISGHFSSFEDFEWRPTLYIKHNHRAAEGTMQEDRYTVKCDRHDVPMPAIWPVKVRRQTATALWFGEDTGHTPYRPRN